MLHKTINITTDGRVNMQTYIHDTHEGGFQIPKRPVIIVLPGGAYYRLSPADGEPVALTFLKEGFNTFVLNYSIKEYSEFPNPLEDVSKAIWEIRKNAEEWGIDPDAITVMGFSAGSGVANMAATQWNTPGLAERLGIPEGGNKPNAAVIGYGASDTRTYMDDDDVYKPNLGKIALDRAPELDVVNYVGAHTPPLFIWHNRNDRLVPADQPLRMAQEMQRQNLQYELHVFQLGRHGMSVFNNLSSYNDKDINQKMNVDLWVQMCTNWLYNLFNI